MPSFRLLHLSDPHFRAFLWRGITSLVFSGDAAKEILDLTRRWHQNGSLDAVLITGDLAFSGQIDHLKEARSFVDSLGRPERSTVTLGRFIPGVDSPSLPIFLLPGNHDRFVNWPACEPGCANFEHVFPEFWPLTQGAVAQYFLPSHDDPLLAMVCADFSLASTDDATAPGGRWGQGEVYPDRLDLLSDKTQKIRRRFPKAGVVWALHFAPWRFRSSSTKEDLKPSMRLNHSSRFAQRAAALGIRHVFCGHTHEHNEYWAQEENTVQVHCAGTSTISSPRRPKTIHFVEIQVEDGNVERVRTLNYIWDGTRFR